MDGTHVVSGRKSEDSSVDDVENFDREVMYMMEIRETTMEDLTDIRRLWADGEVMHFVGFPEGLHRSEEEMQQWYRRLDARRPSSNHYVVLDEGVFCGEAFYAIDEAHGHRADLDIKLSPFARGKGIAAKALAHAIDEAFRHGAEAVCVTPNARNAKALALYAKLGFQEKEMPEDLMQEGAGGAYLYMERKRQAGELSISDLQG